jgi:hypothetical protein
MTNQLTKLNPRVRDSEVVEAEFTHPSTKSDGAPPSLVQAIGKMVQSVDLAIMKDIIFEFERTRMGEVRFRFRCYR